jgi:hypothetical protein
LYGIASIRKQQQTWGRRALGLFVAVWLNLALQPCAMANAMESEQQPMQMHEHGGALGNMDMQMPCADGVADCSIDDDLNHDGRSGQIELKDSSNDLPLAVADCSLQLKLNRSADAPLLARYGLLHSGAPPPFYVLHCAYLK